MDHYHFVGILGYGMKALASIYLEKGVTVTGTDASYDDKNHPFKQHTLIMKDASDSAKHCDILIYSTAIKSDHPDIINAKKNNIQCIHRSELIQKLFDEHQYNIAVTGTHGKTTTSAIMAYIFKFAGLNPTFVIGGEPEEINQSEFGDSKYLIVESDESDGSCLNTYPSHILITNFESDHLEMHDNDFNVLKSTLLTFSKRAQVIFAHYDDIGVQTLLQNISGQIVTYGFDPKNDYQILDIQRHHDGMSIYFKQKQHQIDYVIHTPLHGKHNALNLVGAFSVGAYFNIDTNVMIESLSKFNGVKRRLQTLGDTQINHHQVTVIDDYAHHPTEIQATIDTMMSRDDDLIFICQPHRAARVQNYFDDYVRVLQSIPRLILLDTYEPGLHQDAINPSKKLFDSLVKKNNTVIYCSLNECIEVLESCIDKPLTAVFMGAGDITKIAHRMVK